MNTPTTTTNKKVTENDFRLPQYKDANPDDYEFLIDGTIARKDRYYTALNTIRHLVGISSRSYEIEDIIKAVETLSHYQHGWETISSDNPIYPKPHTHVEVRLNDGSTLRNSSINSNNCWSWNNKPITDVIAWRHIPKVSLKNLLRIDTPDGIPKT